MTKDAEDLMSVTDFQKYGEMNPAEFEFQPPEECPVFRPSVEDFKDPLGYIAKIRPIAEESGICKIIPPQEWQPPFAVDVDNFRFTPRMQRLNELEATTRIKLNFLDQIAKFWELQGSPVKTYLRGSSLKIPNVERKALDLFTLYRVVHDEGGMEIVSRDRKWSRIATRMGYPSGRGVGTLLRQHYERILYPYDVFQSGASLGELKSFNDDSDDCEKRDRDYIPHGIPSRQAIKPPPDRYARRSKRHGSELEEQMDGIDYSTNSELKKLQFYGAGPKMPGYLAKGKYDTDEDSKLCNSDSNSLESKISSELKENITPSSEVEKLSALLNKSRNTLPGKRPIEQIVCTLCSGGDDEASMLLCDGCDDSYHTFCLIPPLSEIPKGDWRCPRCVAEEVCKPQEAFGFEQAQREYTLQEFGEKADQFKSNYFGMPGHKVPCSAVEKEFWRIVNAVDEDVTVEYGADLHTIDHGSGFPNKKTKNLLPTDEEYVNSGWNLNNLPVLEGSILRHINADISGMKIPWTYVGMCFATFCWHNEDHWSYSINYLHWGEPKTWYGVPGKKAENFEDAMRSVAPELFHTQPDLLHQLVTIMNPNLLTAKNVPIFRTNQQAGEFVVTFPRSYHAGFNQGYNFAEAVNFAPSDWLPIGRVCVAHYSQLHRFCVFSHDELICFMATHTENLDVSIASSTYADMMQMVQTEKALRIELLEWGVTNTEQKSFELLPDDERQCDYCKTTCFLSAVTCSCSYGQKIVCIPHKDKLCSKCAPSDHVLWYRYTMNELPNMMRNLKNKAEEYDKWTTKVRKAVVAEGDEKLDMTEFKELIEEAEEMKLKSDLLPILSSAVEEAEKCSSIAQQLLSRKVITRNRQSSDSKNLSRLSLQYFRQFEHQLSTLPCILKETKPIKELYEMVLKIGREAREAINDDSCDAETLEKIIEDSLGVDIDIPEVPLLKQKLVQRHWVEEVDAVLSDPSHLGLDILRKFLKKGINLPPHRTVERVLAQLQELLTVGEKWEEKAKECLQARPRFSAKVLEDILNEAGSVLAHLPHVALLRDALRKAKDWTLKVQMLQNGTHNPYLDVLEYLIIKGKPIPVHLEQYAAIKHQVIAANAWREKTARTFLKKNSPFTLLEILSPRKEVGFSCIPKSKKKKGKDPEDGHKDDVSFDVKFEEAQDPASIVAAFKMAEKHELEAMQQLRAKNLRKHLEDSAETRYCICNRTSTSNMLQCELCKDWFHANCVPPPKVASQKKQQHSSLSLSPLSQLSKEIKFLCPMCMRSRRPRLETILSLLLSLQKLPMRLPEGEALQCLTERGMSWQDRVRKALETKEIAIALSRLTFYSQKINEQAAREKTEKIISMELMKAASNPELKQHLQTVAPNAFSGLSNGSSFGVNQNQSLNLNTPLFNTKRDFTSLFHPDESTPSVAAVQEISSADPPRSMDVDLSINVRSESGASSSLDGKNTEGPDISTNYSLEHAYSSVSKATAMTTTTTPATACSNVTAASPRKHPRKTPLVARQMETPVLQLSDAAIAQLEQLMMEGDLLEMSLEETQHIWSILQGTKVGKDTFTSVSPFCDLEDNMSPLPCMKKKKRKVDDTKAVKAKPLKNKMKLVEKEDGKPRKKKVKMGKECIEGVCENTKLKKFKPKGDGKKEHGPHVKKGFKIGKPRFGSIEKMALKKIKKAAAAGKKNAANEIEDICSASTCLRPIGEAVNWVQCDGGCEQWFHMLCVGLDVNQVTETDDYICPYCSNKKLLAMDSFSNLPIKQEPLDEDMVYAKTNSSVLSSNSHHGHLTSSADNSMNEAFTPENSESMCSIISHGNSENVVDNPQALSFGNCAFSEEKALSVDANPSINFIKSEIIEQESDLVLVQ